MSVKDWVCKHCIDNKKKVEELEPIVEAEKQELLKAMKAGPPPEG
jgi:hypothetical protein